jgi:hypothetical protein
MQNFLNNPVGVIVVAALILVYIGTYILNKRTPVPEECRELFDNVSCTACSNFTCSHKGK